MEVRHETERPILTKRNENFCKCICISINNIDQKFSFTFGSHYNRNCVIKPQLALGLLHNLGPIMLCFGRNALTFGRGTACSLSIIFPCGDRGALQA